MKRLSLLIGLLLVSVGASAQTRITSGTADQYAPFVAVDSTDGVTRETGLSSFTVYRKRENGSATAMTTPTVVEADATNMPGAYLLLLDEDTTIGSGNDNEVMTLHITATGMRPVTTAVEIYRPKITEGSTSAAQTGDTFARVGVPAGASVSADIAALLLQVANAKFGIIESGTAQGGAAGNIQLASSVSRANNFLNCATVALTGGTGAGQSRVIDTWTSSTDTGTMTVDWTTAPSSDSTYLVFQTPCGISAGGGATADEVADEVETRSLIVGTNNDKTGYGLADGAITAPKIATDALTAAKAASDLIAEIQSGLATAAALDAVDNYVDTEIAALAAAIAALNNLSSADILSAIRTAQGLITGTCDSGSTTTCVDNALTQAAESQLDDRLILFDDGWTARITGFTPGSDTVTTTKVAPSTRASKVYIIFPMTAD